MTQPGASSIGITLRFLGLALGISLAAVALGYWPTKRLGGPGAVSGMLVGCGISLIASLIGAIPIVAAQRGSAAKLLQAVLMSTAVRFLVVLMLALSAALCGWFDRSSVLVWVAISYMLLLVADTLYALRISGSLEPPKR